MYIVIVGGGQVGYYLTRGLLTAGHEVVLIEQDERKAARIAEELGQGVVLRGRGDEASTLEQAGTKRAETVVAVTGDDEDNLVICQVARRRFHVARTIARVHNPRNEDLFRRLGIDVTVSSTNVLLSIFEQEIPAYSLVHLATVRQANVEICEIHLSASSPAVGKQLGSLLLPPDTHIGIVLRGEERITPQPSSVLKAEDRMIAFTSQASEPLLRQIMLGLGSGTGQPTP